MILRKNSLPDDPKTFLRSLRHFFILLLFITGVIFNSLGLAASISYSGPLIQLMGSWTPAFYIFLGICLLSCMSVTIYHFLILTNKVVQKKAPVPFRLFFYFIVSATVFYLITFDTVSHKRLLLVFSFVFGFCSFIQLFLWLKSKHYSFPGDILRMLDIILMNICVFIIIMEMGVRVISLFIPSPLLSRSISSAEHKIGQNRFPAGSVRYGFPFNKDGYYDTAFLPRKEGNFLVINIGDSFNVGVVPHYYHFTTISERELRYCDVYNMGIPDIGPVEYLHLMKTKALPLNPNLIIINLFTGNDLSLAESQKHQSTIVTKLLRSLFERNSYYLYLIPKRFVKMYMEKLKTGHIAGKIQGEDTDQEIVKQTPEILEKHFPWISSPLKEVPTFSSHAHLFLTSHRIWEICRQDRYMYEQFFKVLEDIIQAAGKTPVAFMLVPDEFQVEDSLWEMATKRLDNKSIDRYLPQRKIKKWLDAKEIPYLDLLPIMKKTPVLTDNKRHLYHLRDTHLNVRGNIVAGKAFAIFIRNQLTSMPESPLLGYKTYRNGVEKIIGGQGQ